MLRVLDQPAEAFDNRAVVVVQPARGAGGKLLESLGVGQPVALNCQVGRFPRPEPGRVQLLALETDQAQLALAGFLPGEQVRPAATKIAYAVRDLVVVPSQVAELAKRIEKLDLVGRPE